MNNQNLGKLLSKKDMKSVKGGVAWPDFRSFICENGSGIPKPGGCSDISSYGHTCCNKLGMGYGPTWGAYGCGADICYN